MQQYPKRLTTTEVVAQLKAAGFKCSADTVRRMIEDGLFPNAIRDGAGAHWRVPEAEVAAFIEEKRRPATPVVRRNT